MPKFRVAIFQNSSQVFFVEADNRASAIEKISDAWDSSDITLDNPDICEADFSVIGCADNNVRAIL